MKNERTQAIADANDASRKVLEGLVVTPGLRWLNGLTDLLDMVRTYDAFTPDNDPYDEHDFGSVEWRGEKVFWKIDYYDVTLQHGEDPLNVNCRRVLTVMLANEY